VARRRAVGEPHFYVAVVCVDVPVIARFDVYPISRAVATTAAAIIASLKEAGEPLHDLHDVYIGATAKTQQLPLLTGNVDHLERIDGLTVLDWEGFV